MLLTPPAILLTEESIFESISLFMNDLFSASVEIVRGQDNRVPEPSMPNFVVMTPLLRKRLATNIVTTHDGFPDGQPGTRNDTQKTQLTVQLDVHGPQSGDNAQVLSTMLRSDIACNYFAEIDADISPLFTSDPRQVPYLNGEQQIENRWTVDFELQANIAVQTAQDFADTLTIRNRVINVDVTYPP